MVRCDLLRAELAGLFLFHRETNSRPFGYRPLLECALIDLHTDIRDVGGAFKRCSLVADRRL